MDRLPHKRGERGSATRRPPQHYAHTTTAQNDTTQRDRRMMLFLPWAGRGWRVWQDRMSETGVPFNREVHDKTIGGRWGRKLRRSRRKGEGEGSEVVGGVASRTVVVEGRRTTQRRQRPRRPKAAAVGGGEEGATAAATSAAAASASADWAGVGVAAGAATARQWECTRKGLGAHTRINCHHLPAARRRPPGCPTSTA